MAFIHGLCDLMSGIGQRDESYENFLSKNLTAMSCMLCNSYVIVLDIIYDQEVTVWLKNIRRD